MNILLTGSNGFLGSHILKRLLRDEHSVVIVKRLNSDCFRIKNEISKCRCYNLEDADIEQIFAEEKIDAVIHCATCYGRSGKEPTGVLEANVVFAEQVLVAAADSGCHYFINTDTFFSKQTRNGRWLEEDAYMIHYTLSKAQFSQWGKVELLSKEFAFINMQLEHVFGEMDNENKLIMKIVNACRTKSEMKMTDGLQKRDFIYVADVAEAFCCILNNLEQFAMHSYTMLEVGTGQARTIRELAETIKRQMNSQLVFDFGAFERNKNEMEYSCADNSALIKMGWSCEHDLEKTIRKMLDNLGGSHGGSS